MKKTQAVKEILKNQEITSWFQAIVNMETKEILGWEAFSKGPSVGPHQSTPEMFQSAAEAGILKPFDLMCMHSAANCFEQLQLEKKLFINLTNEMLVASSRLKERVGDLMANSNVPSTRIVLEIDESSTGKNTPEYVDAVHFFHQQGFEVAIVNPAKQHDASFQELWSDLNPDYIKIDRHCVKQIDIDLIKQEKVRDIVAIARAVNSKVIAEGVETQNELKTLRKLGIQTVQGYLIQRPALAPKTPDLDKLAALISSSDTDSAALACDLVVSQEQINADTAIKKVIEMFENKTSISSMAVVENERVIGMVHRRPFLAKLGTRQRLNVVKDKAIRSEMATSFLNVDSHLQIEQVSRLVTTRARIHSELDFVINRQGKFLGIGTVIDLLRKITQLRVEPSGEINLLTMLPGNIPIGDCIDDLLERGVCFTIALLDLTNFKPFNNYYGHNKGDELLVVFADTIRKHIDSETDFAGHMGGDDFVVVIRQENWPTVLGSLLDEFNHRVAGFYSKEHLQNSGIQAIDNQGNEPLSGLVTVAAGAMTITDEHFDTFQTLLTALIQLKQLTKRDDTLCVAHQQKDIINLHSFSDGQLNKVVSEHSR